ncbi:MAG: alpha/beta hydrolase [Actinomycetota bacterium]
MSVDAGTTTLTVMANGAAVPCMLAGIDREGVDPVVLLPGVGGTIESDFAFLLPLLARTHRVLAVDLRYGIDATPTLGALVGQLAEVLRQTLPGRRVTLVGFSVGATVAAEFSAANPAVGALVLVAPVLRASYRHRMVARLRASMSASDRDALQSLDRFTAYSPSFLQAAVPEESAVEGTAAKHRLFVDTDLTESVSRIGVPTLVVGCTQDDLAGVDQARMFFVSLPNARYAEIDSGHAVISERPAEVLAIIREFAADPVRHRPGFVLDRARP